jgi:hypothetical protein
VGDKKETFPAAHTGNGSKGSEICILYQAHHQNRPEMESSLNVIYRGSALCSDQEGCQICCVGKDEGSMQEWGAGEM